MKVSQYNPTDLQLVSNDITGADFGTVVQGKHCEEAIVIKPSATVEGSFTKLALFLEDNAGFNHSAFGKFKSSIAINGIEPGSDYLSDNFTEVTGVTDFSNYSQISGLGLELDAVNPEYVWLDTNVGSSETPNVGTVNYRFIFEYS